MPRRGRRSKMSDAAQNLEQKEVNQAPTEQQESKPSYEELAKRLDSVLAKHNQLMDETKTAKRERSRLEAEQAENDSKSAEKNGEFEKLWKAAAKEKEDLSNQIKAMKHGSRSEKLDLASMRIATELADGDNAELLSEFIKRNLESIADDDGTLGEDVLKAVASGFKNNGKFKSLLRASKASGGGAPGNMKGTSEKTSLTRADFDRMSPIKKSEFIGKVRNGSAELID